MSASVESQVGTNEEEETLGDCIRRVRTEHPEMSTEDVWAQCTQQPKDTTEKKWLPKAEESFKKLQNQRRHWIDKRPH